MDPASHFLVGALCGAALGGVAMVLAGPARRARVALGLPLLVLGCGVWGELPFLLGLGETTHPLANLCLGYAWLHPWLRGHGAVAFVAIAALGTLFVAAYAAFVVRCLTLAGLIRWEQEGSGKSRSSASRESGEKERRPSRR